MTINKIVEGDMIKMALNGDFDVIIQGNNCFAVQGTGLAPQMTRAFAGLMKADRDFPIPIGSRERLGNYSYVQDGDVLAINSYTQYGTGGRRRGEPDVNYDAIRDVFTRLNVDLESQPSLRIGIPLIGCGLAGGDWSVVRSIIDSVTPNLNITLVEYKA